MIHALKKYAVLNDVVTELRQRLALAHGVREQASAHWVVRARVVATERAPDDATAPVIDESRAEMHELSNMTEKPLTALEFDQLCPGKDKLDGLMERYR